MLSVSRAVLLVAAAGLAVGGLVAIAAGDVGGAFGGFWLIVSAAVLALAVAFERARYRPEQESTDPRVPPRRAGATEAGGLEVRFRPTGEVFVDPTSGRRIRVFTDGATGERRYRDDA